jgi:hypothetical protein
LSPGETINLASVKLALIGIAALGGIAFSSGTASAMPNGLPDANQVSNIDKVRWVCNPWGRCHLAAELLRSLWLLRWSTVLRWSTAGAEADQA